MNAINDSNSLNEYTQLPKPSLTLSIIRSGSSHNNCAVKENFKTNISPSFLKETACLNQDEKNVNQKIHSAMSQTLKQSLINNPNIKSESDNFHNSQPQGKEERSPIHQNNGNSLSQRDNNIISDILSYKKIKTNQIQGHDQMQQQEQRKNQKTHELSSEYEQIARELDYIQQKVRIDSFHFQRWKEMQSSSSHPKLSQPDSSSKNSLQREFLIDFNFQDTQQWQKQQQQQQKGQQILNEDKSTQHKGQTPVLLLTTSPTEKYKVQEQKQQQKCEYTQEACFSSSEKEQKQKILNVRKQSQQSNDATPILQKKGDELTARSTHFSNGSKSCLDILKINIDAISSTLAKYSQMKGNSKFSKNNLDNNSNKDTEERSQKQQSQIKMNSTNHFKQDQLNKFYYTSNSYQAKQSQNRKQQLTLNQYSNTTNSTTINNKSQHKKILNSQEIRYNSIDKQNSQSSCINVGKSIELQKGSNPQVRANSQGEQRIQKQTNSQEKRNFERQTLPNEQRQGSNKQQRYNSVGQSQDSSETRKSYQIQNQNDIDQQIFSLIEQSQISERIRQQRVALRQQNALQKQQQLIVSKQIQQKQSFTSPTKKKVNCQQQQKSSSSKKQQYQPSTKNSTNTQSYNNNNLIESRGRQCDHHLYQKEYIQPDSNSEKRSHAELFRAYSILINKSNLDLNNQNTQSQPSINKQMQLDLNNYNQQFQSQQQQQRQQQQQQQQQQRQQQQDNSKVQSLFMINNAFSTPNNTNFSTVSKTILQSMTQSSVSQSREKCNTERVRGSSTERSSNDNDLVRMMYSQSREQFNIDNARGSQTERSNRDRDEMRMMYYQSNLSTHSEKPNQQPIPLMIQNQITPIICEKYSKKSQQKDIFFPPKIMKGHKTSDSKSNKFNEFSFQ